MHLIACDDLLVLLAVGREGYSPVEEYLEVRPYVLDVLLSRNFENAHEHGEHPRRYAGDVCNVLVHRLAGNPVAFDLEVADERCGLLRYPDEFGQRRDILDEDGTEVADERVGEVVVRLVAASENEASAVEDAALGIVVQIERDAILRTLIVNVLQALLRDGYELALVVGCSGALGIPLHQSGPQNVLLAMAHTVDVALERLVVVDGYVPHVVVVIVDMVEKVLHTELRILCPRDEKAQNVALHLLAVGRIGVKLAHAALEEHPCYTGQTHLFDR